MEQSTKNPTHQPLEMLENWVDEAVMNFVIEMKYKLRLNNHKGHWGDYDFSWLMTKLRAEVKELEQALTEASDASQGSKLAVIHECADIANFACMIADNVRKQIRKTSQYA